MQAYYETHALLSENHQLTLQLPDTIPTGQIRIAVIYEIINPKQSAENTKQFNELEIIAPNLNAEPKNLLDFLGAGKAHARFTSAAEIDKFVTDNREVWQCND